MHQRRIKYTSPLARMLLFCGKERDEGHHSVMKVVTSGGYYYPHHHLQSYQFKINNSESESRPDVAVWLICLFCSHVISGSVPLARASIILINMLGVDQYVGREFVDGNHVEIHCVCVCV